MNCISLGCKIICSFLSFFEVVLVTLYWFWTRLSKLCCLLRKELNKLVLAEDFALFYQMLDSV